MIFTYKFRDKKVRNRIEFHVLYPGGGRSNDIEIYVDPCSAILKKLKSGLTLHWTS